MNYRSSSSNCKFKIAILSTSKYNSTMNPRGVTEADLRKAREAALIIHQTQISKKQKVNNPIGIERPDKRLSGGLIKAAPRLVTSNNANFKMTSGHGAAPTEPQEAVNKELNRGNISGPKTTIQQQVAQLKEFMRVETEEEYQIQNYSPVQTRKRKIVSDELKSSHHMETLNKCHSFDTQYDNYENDPSEAQLLFWETSALHRYQQPVESESLKEEIRATIVTDEVKRLCLSEYLREMDDKRMRISICGVCNTSSFDSMSNIPISQVSDLLLLSTEEYARISSSRYKEAYSVYWARDHKAYYINPSVVQNGQVPICDQCSAALGKNKLPKYALRNGYDLGQWQRIGLPQLTYAEKMAISFYQPFGKLIKLIAPHGLGPESQQTGLRGHIIYFPLDGPEILSTELPRRDIYSDIQVIFIGAKQKFNLMREKNAFRDIHQRIFHIRADVIMQWLHVLKEV
jgi:hypothetical protein